MQFQEAPGAGPPPRRALALALAASLVAASSSTLALMGCTLALMGCSSAAAPQPEDRGAGTANPGAPGAEEPEGPGANPGPAQGEAGAAACSPPSSLPGEDPVALEEHACIHVENGPFATVAAEPQAGMPTVELRNTHVAYTVTLDEGAGAVSFMPRVAGTFAFFVDDDTVPFRVVTEAGAELCPTASRAPVACAPLRRMRSYPLERRVRYRIDLGAAPQGKVLVLVEQVS